MAGGLIELVAQGIQDAYLTEQPQITFFKVVFRRHTNFAIESVVQNFSSRPNFGEKVSCTISRMGDLVGKIFLYVEIPSLPKFVDLETGEENSIKKIAWVNNLGYALINEINIEIGGKEIDKQYGEWMYIWSQVSNRQDTALNKMIGNVPEIYQFSNGKAGYQLYIPLEFWFCRNHGLSLPLIALASSEVKISVTFRRLEECYRIGPTHSIEIDEDISPFNTGDYIEQTVDGQTIHGYVIDYDYLTQKLYYIKIQSPIANKKTFENSNKIYDSINHTYVTPKKNAIELIEPTNLWYQPSFGNCKFYVDYVYLDNDERNKFSRSSHEYLIEQIQFNQEIGIRSPNVKQNLTLNHPCKAHYWVAQLDSLVGQGTINDLFNYTSSHMPNGDNLIEKSELIVNGRSRFGQRGSEYLNLQQPLIHHHRGPNTGINVYSFSLYPENHQPSSTINMSKLDQINMEMRLKNVINSQNSCRIRSYTINYNILRILMNLGGLAF